MKIKMKKMITIIILILASLMIMTSTSIAADELMDPQYIVKSDDQSTGAYYGGEGKIYINGNHYWCIHKGWSLTKGIIYKKMATNNELTYESPYPEGTFQQTQFEKWLADALANWEHQYYEHLFPLSQIYETLTIDELSTTPNLTDKQEKYIYAIFALAEKNGCSDAELQRAIWAVLGQYDATYLSTAAKKLVDDWIPDTSKPNFSLTNSSAVIDVNQSNNTYLVGPVKVNLDEVTYGGVSLCWIDGWSVTDQNGNTITGAKIVDKSGNEISIPNNSDFYIKIPYEGNESLTEIKINVSIEYIDSVTGGVTEYQIKKQQWRYVSKFTVTKKSGILHAKRCTIHPATDYGTKRYFEETPVQIRCEYDATGAQCQWDYYAQVHAWFEALLENDDATGLQPLIQGYGNLTTKSTSKSISLEIENDMEIAGNVWEDMPENKATVYNGYKDSNDVNLSGIEVRLYEVDSDGNYTMAAIDGSQKRTFATISGGVRCTNPTITDNNGFYEFKGLNPTKKYVVAFVYDGMFYTNTYGAGLKEYNTVGANSWETTSKGSELVSDRQTLNAKFVTIGSHPGAYRTTAIFSDKAYLIDLSGSTGYNPVYLPTDSKVQEYRNKISQKLLSRIKDTSDSLSNISSNSLEIYKSVLADVAAADKVEASRILQYLWDCKINSYAGHQSYQDGTTLRAGGKKYPYKNKIILSDENGNRLTATEEKSVNGYYYIYNGQLHVNLGLIERNTTNLSVYQDLSQLVLSINGKDETYKYNAITEKKLEVPSSDIEYYQSIAEEDYNYAVTAGNLGDVAAYEQDYAPIEIYPTYKIVVSNESGVVTSLKELVTYIDTNYYSYSDSYTTTQGNEIAGLVVKHGKTSGTTYTATELDLGTYGITTNKTSRYSSYTADVDELKNATSVTEMSDLKDMYIYFDKNIYLENKEKLEIYITYRLGENSTKDNKYNCTYTSPQAGGGNSATKILQDHLKTEGEDGRFEIHTMSEINAFSTFFKKAADVTNTKTNYASYYTYTSLASSDTYRAAGVMDAISIAGNLNQTEISNAANSRQTENDWDNAATLVLIRGEGARTITGNVWETVGITANDLVKDPTRYEKYNDSAKIQGITVELVEIKGTTETVRARTRTDATGAYKIQKYIPGDYVVRFTYGDTEVYSQSTTMTLHDLVDYRAAFNGQFYQSTKANPNTNTTQFWYAGAEADNERYSDAYDEVNIRQTVNNVLSSGYTYKDTVHVVKHPTEYMVYAYTSVLDIYPEKAKTETTGAQTPGYEISNVDFGLTPRTETKLNINKEVSHLKLILQNGFVQFDVDTETIRQAGVEGVKQAAAGHDIMIEMSNELVNGATLEITYKVTVTNMSPYDSVTYYKDASGNTIALGLYEESPVNIVYNEGDIRKHNATPHIDNVGQINAGTTSLVANDESKTEIKETTTKPTVIADFVSNNLNFITSDYTSRTVNEAWEIYTGTKEDFIKQYYQQNDEDKAILLYNNNGNQLATEDGTYLPTDMKTEEVYDSNVIVVAKADNELLSKDLRPLSKNNEVTETSTEEITLSKVVSLNSDSSDKKVYYNTIRILGINNSVSRIQDMNAATLRYVSERVTIADPTGIGLKYLGIAITLVVVAIIGVGVIFIKKYALPKR